MSSVMVDVWCEGSEIDGYCSESELVRLRASES